MSIVRYLVCLINLYIVAHSLLKIDQTVFLLKKKEAVNFKKYRKMGKGPCCGAIPIILREGGKVVPSCAEKK